MAFHLQQALLKNDFQKSLNKIPIRAILGDASGILYDTQNVNSGYVWVRQQTSNGLSTPQRVRGPYQGAAVQMVCGNPVILKLDTDGQLFVAGPDFNGAVAQGINPGMNNAADENASQWTNQSSIVTLVSHCTAPPSLSVAVRGWMAISNLVITRFSGATIDLTSFVPSAGNQRLVVIVIKSDFATLAAYASTTKDATDILTIDGDVQECLTAAAAVDANAIPIWAWRLHDGQTTITDKDSWLDLRQFVDLSVIAASQITSGVLPIVRGGTGQTNGRLTLSSTLSVPTSDLTGQSTLYLLPYDGNRLPVKISSVWTSDAIPDAGISVAVPSTLFRLFDVFAYDNSGTLTLETLNWNQTTGSVTGATNATPVVITSNGHGLATNDLVGLSGLVGNTAPNGKFWVVGATTANTFELLGCAGNGAWSSGGTWYKVSGATRATALAEDGGFKIKSGDATRHYLGTGLTGGTSGQMSDSEQFRCLWNNYNRVLRKYKVSLAGDHTYGTAAWRIWGNNGQNLCILVEGIQEDTVEIAVNGAITGNATGNTYLAGTIDYANSGTLHAFYIWPTLANTFNLGSIKEEVSIAAGAHFAVAVQYVSAGTSTYYDSGRLTGRISN